MEYTPEVVEATELTQAQRARIKFGSLMEIVLPPLIFFVLLISAWEIYVTVREIPEIIMPRPSSILGRLFEDPGYFFIENGLLTFSEALLGFTVGAVAALLVAAVMARSVALERSIFPLAVIVKATPLIVIAPLLIIWFGYTIYPKVIMAALLCFFPILVNTIIGLRSVDPTSLEFFHSVAASEWEIMRRLRVPHSMPYVLSGFKTAVSLAVIGAVIAEWSGAGEGLGRVIYIQAAHLDQKSVFAGIVVLAIMGILLTGVVTLFERTLLFWHESRVS